MAIGRFSARCSGHDGSGRRCTALGPDADTAEDALRGALDAGWTTAAVAGVVRCAYCPAHARRDVVGPREGDGRAGAARCTRWGGPCLPDERGRCTECGGPAA